jgi:hypothetical protein
MSSGEILGAVGPYGSRRGRVGGGEEETCDFPALTKVESESGSEEEDEGGDGRKERRGEGRGGREGRGSGRGAVAQERIVERPRGGSNAAPIAASVQPAS